MNNFSVTTPLPQTDTTVDISIDPALQNLCRQYGALAVASTRDELFIAVPDKCGQQLDVALRFACGKQITRQVWSSAQLEDALNNLHGKTYDAELTLAAQKHKKATEPDAHYTLDTHQDEPVVNFINQTLEVATQRRASDIHFEPFANSYRIRLRIDGVLQEISSPPPSLAARMTARLKIISSLDIAERRQPQDGQLALELSNRTHAMRISTLPTLHGEKIVLRVQENDKSTLSLQDLGLTAEQYQCYTHALQQPQGMILVTGPTGSGKTLTLYSGLKQLNSTQRNICSAEDPIEMPLKGINQTQTNIKIGLTFSTILRAMLRQDPDIIMIGEIRDAETAEIAIKAAQTGHLVLSTLHTNSACEALNRLEQMGIAPYLLASSLKLVIAQRLVRRLCSHCKQFVPESNRVKPTSWMHELKAWKAIGCEHCFSGYYGRVGLYELLSVTPEIQQAVLDGVNLHQLQTLAEQQGVVSLFHSGLKLVDQGITSLEEVYRVLGLNS